ncbi:MAG: hypothetical protein HY893_01495 [Deltaproteobacteria bacterium]|nr:hypothetical protein [Deltaproteobacteria bacterium]
MKKRLLLLFAAGLLSLSFAPRVTACDTACPLPHASRWDKLVEKSFGLPRGLGIKLMTEEKWEEQKKIMFRMSRQERQEYKNSMHQKLVEAANEKGLAVPQARRTTAPDKGRDFNRPFVYAAKQSPAASATPFTE